MWVEGGKVVFQCRVKERGDVVLTNGVAEVDGLSGGGAAAGGAGGEASSSGGSGLKSAPFFDQIAAAIKADGPALVKQVKGVIQFDVSGGAWVVDLKNGSGSVYEGKAKGKPDMTLSVSDDDFVKLAAGKLNAQQAFMQGKIKIKGNMGLAMKLGTVIKAAGKSKL